MHFNKDQIEWAHNKDFTQSISMDKINKYKDYYLIGYMIVAFK